MKEKKSKLDRYNDFVATANKYLSLRNQVVVFTERIRSCEKEMNYLERKDNSKGATKKDKSTWERREPQLAATIVEADTKIMEIFAQRRALEPQLRKEHTLLVGAHHKDGQRTFKVPYSFVRGNYIHAPIYNEEPSRKASYTRHVKGGTGYAVIYGDLLPPMRYG